MAYGGRTRNLRIHSYKVLSTNLPKVERSVERLQAISGAERDCAWLALRSNRSLDAVRYLRRAALDEMTIDV